MHFLEYGVEGVFDLLENHDPAGKPFYLTWGTGSVHRGFSDGCTGPDKNIPRHKWPYAEPPREFRYENVNYFREYTPEEVEVPPYMADQPGVR